MKNGFGKICEIWYGNKNNKQLIEYIPFLGDFNVNYTLKCEEDGNLFIGILVDGDVIKVYEYKISPPKIDEEVCLWFKYPLRKKTAGEHKIEFVIGHQNNISNKTNIPDIEWCYKSKEFKILVK